MYSSESANFSSALDNFHLDGLAMRYSKFIPRLYNYCLSLGMTPGKIMPSRAFCSDESQGYPIILITRHFGTFPFNHGRVGGIVATDRHGPHASHGKDMVIIQASHVGYDANSNKFGIYRRIQTQDAHHSSNCGKIAHVLSWYQREYRFAQRNIFLEPESQGAKKRIKIDNQLQNPHRDEGLFLKLESLIAQDEDGAPRLVQARSTSRIFEASEKLVKAIKNWPTDKARPIAEDLAAEFFYFKRNVPDDTEGKVHLEVNLLNPMPWIITHSNPMLAAACFNTQIEFDRTYRTIIKEKGYKGKHLVFISGLNIDISPEQDQVFPLTKFIPWAAYLQNEQDGGRILEQHQIYEALKRQTPENPDQIDLEEAIHRMTKHQEVRVSFD